MILKSSLKALIRLRNQREFYKNHLLLTEGRHVQSELFTLLEQHDELCQVEPFNLFGFIQAIRKLNITTSLNEHLLEIEQSERVLVPYVYLFKTLQSKPIWKQDKINEASIFKTFPKAINHPFKTEVIAYLNKSLDNNPNSIALEAVKRNIDISKIRGNAPWMKQENNELVTCYADGRRLYLEVNVGQDFEHNYFLPSYLSMYQQIMKR